MLHRLLNSQAKTITFAAALLSASALISRVFGLVRQGLIAGYFGRTIEADIYFAAFRMPDFIYNILIAGGLLVAFLPLFSEYWQKGKETAWEMTNYILNGFLFLLIFLCLIFFIWTPWLVKIIAPGFPGQAKAATIALTRLMFLSPIFFGLGSIFSGVLHYFNRFLVYSLAPILYNLGIIFGLVFLSPILGIFGAGLGVCLGAFLHFLIQLAGALKCGFRYQFLFNFKQPAFKKILQLMLPRTFALAAQQISLIAVTAIASTLSTGFVAIFAYSQDIYYLPIGIVSLPLALAVFPRLSRLFSHSQKDEFENCFFSALRKTLLFIVPVAVLMFILRAQLVRLIFGTLGPGHFDWTATKLTAACLGVFSLAILAQGLLPLLCRAFFAQGDTKTPTFVTISTVILNIILCFTFVWLLAPGAHNLLYKGLTGFLKLSGMENISIIGLALAFSLSSLFQLALALFFLNKKLNLFEGSMGQFLKAVLLASMLSGLSTYSVLYFLNNFVATETVLGLFLQTATAGFVGISVYILFGFLFKLAELQALKTALLKRF